RRLINRRYIRVVLIGKQISDHTRHVVHFMRIIRQIPIHQTASSRTITSWAGSTPRSEPSDMRTCAKYGVGAHRPKYSTSSSDCGTVASYSFGRGTQNTRSPRPLDVNCVRSDIAGILYLSDF